MKLIRKCSYKCAYYLTEQLNESHQKRNIFYFGLQVLLGDLLKFILLIILTLFLGTFLETMVVTLFFISLRIFAGGYHMDTYGKCFVVSLAIFIAAGLFVKYAALSWQAVHIIIFAAAIFVCGLYILIKWAPADTPNKPITRPEEIKRLKTLSVIHIFLWILLTYVLLYFKFNMAAFAGCLGILIELFIVSPAGYIFFGFISGKSSKKKKILKSLE